MPTPTLQVAAVFNMSFDEVFVVGHLENHPQLVPPGHWTLTVNGQTVAELEAVGEQLPGRADPATRVVVFRGQLDKRLFEPATDDLRITRQ